MVCHAQKIATSELNGTKWTLVSPVCDYCERGMSFTMDSRTTIEKYKRLNKAFKLPLKFPLFPKNLIAHRLEKIERVIISFNMLMIACFGLR